MFKVFIGMDERQQDAYDVCEYSLRRHSSIPLDVQPVSVGTPGYIREHHWIGNQRYDNIDGKPFSTDFAFARFMVPYLCRYRGWALFVDCDFLFQADVAELQQYIMPQHAVSVVQQCYEPSREVKMDGQIQQDYSAKNWSSFVLWNCGHPHNAELTLGRVNTKHGSWLHRFEWLDSEHIGGLPLEWNWLEGEYAALPRPKAIHFTNGGPWMKNWTNVAYASFWLEEKNLMLRHKAAASNNAA